MAVEILTPVNLQPLVDRLHAATRDTVAGMSNAMGRIARRVWNRAEDYAPRSPKASQIRKTRKTKRRGKRKARATSRPSPGGLERSITWMATNDSAEIFVASNSEAGKYAGRIHDEKGLTWRNRGPGTIAKGPLADEKFLERAVTDSEGDVATILEKEIDKAMRGL